MTENHAGSRSFTKDLWSIIVRTTGEDFNLLRDAIYSIVAQSYADKEVVITYQPISRYSSSHHKKFTQSLEKLIKAVKPFIQVKLIDIDPESDRTYPLQVAKANAQGEYLSFLDYDDIFYPHMGEKLINKMIETKSNFAYGNSVVVHQSVVANANPPFACSTQKVRFYGEEFSKVKMLVDNYIPINTYVLKISEFPEIDFDSTIELAEDWDYLHSLIRTNRFKPVYEDIDVSEYRKRNNESQTHNPELADRWDNSREKIFKKIASDDFLISGKDINIFRETHLKDLTKLRSHIEELGAHRTEQQRHIEHLSAELDRVARLHEDSEAHVNELIAFTNKPMIRYPRKAISKVKQTLKKAKGE